MSNIKYVTEDSLKAVLNKLKEWMPFKKTVDGVVKIEGEIRMGNKVYIKNSDNTEDVLLQDVIGATTIDPPGAIDKNTIDDIIEQYN